MKTTGGHAPAAASRAADLGTRTRFPALQSWQRVVVFNWRNPQSQWFPLRFPVQKGYLSKYPPTWVSWLKPFIGALDWAVNSHDWIMWARPAVPVAREVTAPAEVVRAANISLAPLTLSCHVHMSVPQVEGNEVHGLVGAHCQVHVVISFAIIHGHFIYEYTCVQFYMYIYICMYIHIAPPDHPRPEIRKQGKTTR